MGPLDITPSRANLVLAFVQNEKNTYLLPTIRFKIANTSLADVKVILFRNSITATDDLGEQLFSDSGGINSSGIILSGKQPNQFNQAFVDEKGQFIMLAPKQVFEAQLKNQHQGIRIADMDQDFQKKHRPKTITVSGTLGIIYADTATELRAFSFSDVPVTVSTR